MKFFKLVINELIKNLKKRVTVIFIILAIVSILVCCYISLMKKDEYLDKNIEYSYWIMSEYDIKANISIFRTEMESANDIEKRILTEKIKIYEFLLEEGYKNIITSKYKFDIFNDIFVAIESLYSIDKNVYVSEYNVQEEKLNKLFNLLYEGSFEDYINFNKDVIEQEYKSNIINEEQYKTKIEEQNLFLKYRIGDYSSLKDEWKERIFYNISNIDTKIKDRYDYDKKIFLDDEEIEKLNNQKLINKYRLENDIAPYYTNSQLKYNLNSYCRYMFNELANKVSVIFIGLLIIILASSSIAEESTNGTIKFLLITPYKRYKILFAKIIAIIIIMFVSILLISQISVIIGNIAFGSNSNNYLYVKDGEVNILYTNIYETLQYILRIPEIFIYLLIGIVFSTITRNSAISTVITATVFIGSSVVINSINNFVRIYLLRYLPFNNFDFISKVFYINTYETSYENYIISNSISFSIIVLIVTSTLLIFTALESFNKKDIKNV